ncbi:MAG TPA: outer membrane beta-barrel protein [Gemmatimonadales bacterium]|jgi:hypothetical protein|nr:outer membrane beta-barrel protein [Gemmatimonadales bacterium]
MRPRSAACFAAMLAAAPLAAQAGAPAARTGFSITPYIGVLVPTTDLLDYNNQVTKLSAAVAFGGRVGIGLGARIGIEGDVGYSPGSFDFTSSGASVNTDVKILTGSGKLTVYLIPRTSPFWLGVSGGVGAVRHSFKESSDGTPSPIEAGTDVGGVLGASAGIRIGPLLAVHVGAEDYLYSASFDVNGTKTSGKTQHDLRFTGGIRIPFIGF